MRQLFLPWLAVAVWMAIIFYFSAQPSLGTNLGIWDFILRKAAHFTEFAILSVLAWLALRKSGVSMKVALIAAALFSLLYAFSDEYHQSFVPGRGPSLRDVSIDFVGVVAAMIIITFMVKRHHAVRGAAPNR